MDLQNNILTFVFYEKTINNEVACQNTKRKTCDRLLAIIYSEKNA